MPSRQNREAWLVDQFAKSAFFHKKLHEWGMVEVTDALAQVDGEHLPWDLPMLGITQIAWDRVIHRGIRPVIVFAHPEVLCTIDRAVAYYRQLAMVSQKAMKNIGMDPGSYEQATTRPNTERASQFAKHLNTVISRLVESDTNLDAREFELWRGMASGAQAQGSWQNQKGSTTEKFIQDLVRARLHAKHWVSGSISDAAVIALHDGRQVRFAKDPDIGFYQDGRLMTLVEITGGIDSAGILERFGAMVKSFDHARGAGQHTIKAILIAQGAAITPRARQQLDTSPDVDVWFQVDELLTDLTCAEQFFTELGI